jgi:membrane protein implicated in regulation of membrane protease activity
VIHDSKSRRWLGAVCLLAAIAMLVADEYLLQGRLTGLAFLAYWLVCFIFTLLAICAAFLDVRALRRSTREEQRALFEQTLQNISREKTHKTGHSD